MYAMKIVKIEGVFEVISNRDLEDFESAFRDWVDKQHCEFYGKITEDKYE